MRNFTAYIAAVYIAITGNGFDRIHRVNNTWVYKTVNTVLANSIALKINPNANKGA